MDGILLEDGTFIKRNTLYHIDLARSVFPDCRTIIEAIKNHNCIFIVEGKEFHSGIHSYKDDKILNSEKGITSKQLNFLKEHICELSLVQIGKFPELAKIKGLICYEECYACTSYEDRSHFINGNAEFLNQNVDSSVINEYYHGNLEPDNYCECCKKCRKKKNKKGEKSWN